IPDSVTYIGYGAFKNCTNLTTINYPASLTEASSEIFRGTAVAEIAVPEGVTYLPSYVFGGCLGLTKVTLPSTLASIGSYAFEGCTGLTEVKLPESLTEINSGAFENCTKLKKITLPSTLTSIGSYAFKNCTALTSLTIPAAVTSIGAYALENCAAMDKVFFEGRNININTNAFYNSKHVQVYCNLNSDALMYAVRNGMSFVLTGEGDPGSLLNRSACMYSADMNSISSNGCVAVVLSYSLRPATAANTRNRYLKISIPSNTTLMEETLQLDGTMLQDYSYDDGVLTVPVSEYTGVLRYFLRVDEMKTLVSYAGIQYKIADKTVTDLIGLISDESEVLTISMKETTTVDTFKVSGAAPAAADVTVKIDGEAYATATASNSGRYSTDVVLTDPEPNHNYKVTVSAKNSSGETLETSAYITYREDMPEMGEFLMYYNNHQDSVMDMTDPNALKKPIYFNPAYKMTFTVRLSNPEKIDRVYITSTKSNIKYRMEATYDAAKDLFVASGWFDPDNHNYVPGAISVEYTLKHKTMLVGEKVDVSDFLVDGVTMSDYTISDDKTEVSGVISLEDLDESLAGQLMKIGVKAYDIGTDGDLEDNLKLLGITSNALSYIIPGEGNKRYIANLDFSDLDTWVMVIHDASETVDTIYQLKLSAADFSNPNYNSLFDTACEISNAATLIGVAYEAYGIYKDHEELVNEINMSPHIKDKAGALKAAEDLKNDRMGFMLMMTALPLLVAGGPMVGPAIAFSALIGIMGMMSSTFWDLRIGQIKGEKYAFKWAVDPSGYVYEAVTDNRLSGVTASAYWVEYDPEDPTFWDSTPDEDAGILWDAAPWDQVNPQITDQNGRYRWDVPEGWWQVRYSKTGYEDARSEWLCVSPPQTDVNVGMVSLEAPVFERITAHEQAVTLTASRYLKPDTVSALTLTDGNGEPVAFTLEYPDHETDLQGTVYAREYTLKLGAPAVDDDVFTCTVPADSIYSYADVAMEACTLTAVYEGEKRFVTDSSLIITAGEKLSFEVLLENHDPGDVLVVNTNAADTVKVESVSEFDKTGKAVVTLEAMFAGETTLSLYLINYDLSMELPVTVVSRGQQTDEGFTVSIGETASSDGKAKTPFEVRNFSSESSDVLIVAAVYDGDRMLAAEMFEAAISSDVSFAGAFTFAETGSKLLLRIMLWDPDTYAPIAKACEALVG
ncbi:MAG: leucine-rich repeat domain-containing protein, partial [Clostridiales bacterium]|nr:leucine-rich repeat domain-containing protein [Clostridiales bacterium]